MPAEYRALERHFPLIPYIRESRRLIGTQTLTGAMITRGRMRDCAPWNEDSVATGTYHPDLHGARDVEDFETDLGETLEDKPNRLTFGPFPIPLGCLIPASMEGLLAAEKNISASRLASSATRVHPTVTSIGEAAGVLAALAVRGGMSPRDVPVASVQHELATGGALISPVRIEGIPRDHEDYPLVALAVARRLVPTEVVLEPTLEQYVAVDRGAAVVAAAALLETLAPLSQAPAPVRLPAGSPSIIDGVPAGPDVLEDPQPAERTSPRLAMSSSSFAEASLLDPVISSPTVVAGVQERALNVSASTETLTSTGIDPSPDVLKLSSMGSPDTARS
ncbi:hypothetical protein CFK41_02460 [Brachybacterium ginsengisoli]|uniref:FAD dependent oxidoreductase n=1 Tax=Brachybacterium ginsengisoli TaxID=1331682 RepID=A0A291GUJ4_9MICO|nr:hypothetical protein CFK41_02460 [Brachybacterium ginsengisoli]